MTAPVLVSRKVDCPLCGSSFQYSRPKDHTYSLIRRDSDFCPYYSGPNPEFYVVWVCPKCHFAAYKDDFKELEERSHEPLQLALKDHPLTRAVIFNQPERSLFAAMRSFELAQLCYQTRKFPREVQAGLALRAAWTCRYAGELRREVRYLESARDLYKEAFERGVSRDRHVDDLAVAFLVGELMLRTGD
ncbi:MAG: DUF2225 domain-containing protein, partial [Cyanobacteria bacterium REEB65]|nr:DUF2225 domain-containing protein [Cyanobacteria bacterium REEB65]